MASPLGSAIHSRSVGAKQVASTNNDVALSGICDYVCRSASIIDRSRSAVSMLTLLRARPNIFGATVGTWFHGRLQKRKLPNFRISNSSRCDCFLLVDL